MVKEPKVKEVKEVVVPAIAEVPPVQLPVEIISFDAYFHLLMQKNESIRPWHKPAMEVYAKKRISNLIGTRDEFDKIFESY